MITGVPTALTSFVGRHDELAAVQRLLAERRLVTLTGIGGCGKTRLAATACADLDAVCWIDLSSVSRPEVVPRLVADAVGVIVDPESDPLEALARLLRPRRVLLVLDTCEHLIELAAELTRTLLQGCPQVSVLATSREPLGVDGETVWRVPSLREDDARRLFAERASLVAPEFSASEHEADVLAVCRRVDGIPLAVELAAAWVRALSPGQIADGLEGSVRLLAGGPRAALPRHQTLTASMDWSHQLLDDEERVLFRRLSVFHGSFPLAAVRAVCREGEQDVLDALGRLLDKSLVVPRHGDAETRYRLLDTVRQYGDDRLRAAGEQREIADRHLAHFLALAELAEPGLDHDQDTWRQVLESHRDDIAAALHWALANPQHHEQARRLSAAMARQWFVRGQARDGLQFLARAVGIAPDAVDRVQARLLCGQSMLAMVAGRRGLSVAAAETALRMAAELGDDKIRARSLTVVAYGAFFHDFARCEQLGLQGHRLGAECGEPFAQDWGATIAAYSLTTRDRHAEAVELSRPAYERSLPRGDRMCAGFARGVEIWEAMWCGDVHWAVERAAEVNDIVAPVDDYFTVGTMTGSVAQALGTAGEIDDSLKLIDGVVRSIDQGQDVDAVGYMVYMGLAHLWSGELAEAVSWFERGTDGPRSAEDRWTATRCLPGLTGALRRLGRLDEAAARAEQGIALARGYGAQVYLCDLLDEQGYLLADTDLARAAALHHEALALRREYNLRTVYCDSLDALAGIARRSERFTEAARLFAAGDRARAEIGYPRRPVDEPDHEQALAALRTSLGADEFAAATAEGAALTLDEAVAAASRRRGQRHRSASGWASLTRTEREVVQLVAEGLSNPEIGRRLFVTRATVKTHLAHVFTKLDVANRTELAMVAREHLPAG